MIDYPEGMPCWAPGAANYLATLLTGREHAWEWGGGASTIWLQDLVDHVDVVETDPGWAKRIKNATKAARVTVRLHAMDDPNYVKPNVYMATMLWLVDGYRRIDCLETVRRHAQAGDLVVLDDAMDYAQDLLKGDWKIKRFKRPHPYAGIPINHKKYGHLRNTVLKVHAEHKETWVCQVV